MLLTIAIIAFREFLEAFLLIGLFLGINKKLTLGKQKEILLAASCGIIFSLSLPVIVFFMGQEVKNVLTEHKLDILEGYLLTFSGFLIAYVVFTLHQYMNKYRQKVVTRTKQKMEQEIFDISLFFTIVFFIAREGFEVSLLIATTSLFSKFSKNLEGLCIGFILAAGIGLLTSFGYSKLSVKKIFAYTEIAIMIVGAAMVKNGISLLFINYLDINLNKFLTLPLQFLPDKETIIGHTLNNLLGIERQLSIIQVSIMIAYILFIYYFFKRNNVVKKRNFNKPN